MNKLSFTTPYMWRSVHILFKNILLLSLVFFVAGCDEDDTVAPPVLETSTVEDVEGNVYQTIKIGNQWWMAEDLRTTQFRTGRTIPKVEDNQQWKSTPNPAYCIYQNSPLAPGLLYNFHVVTHPENIAPEGWHIPTDEDWKELEAHLGLNSDELNDTNWRGTDQGDQLKVEATEGWQFYEGVWATNSSGFSAFGGSCRFHEGPFGIPGLKGTGFWWSSTPNQNKGWYRHLDYKKSGVFRYFGHPNYGFSIRCVKD